ncbi:MAG: GNAT family N-acetyltransferase [Chloroflexi bacterium]|nr:GNAT family N-acetyltransferase [Chloroflexota bacterium]
MIRPLRPTDLAGVALFLRRNGAELTAHTWPKVQPESGHLPIGTSFWTPLGLNATWGRSWVARDGTHVVGLVAARGRSDGLVWDVEHLHVRDDDAHLAAALVEAACQEAVLRGARRVFMEVGEDQRGVKVARKAGFERYTSMAVYRLTAPFKLPRLEPLEGRPRLRADELALFSLYGAAVPAPVRAAEALTLDEWSALHRGRKRWSPALIGDRQQYVWEIGNGLVAWLQVVYGQKSQYLELLIDPKYEALTDRFVAYAMKQVSEKASVYVSLREYQHGLSSALERLGFVVEGRYDIYVRQLTVRMPEHQLVPAKLIGG